MKIIEYWPSFVERDEDSRRETIIKDLKELDNIDWLQKKCLGKEIEVIDNNIVRDRESGFVLAFIDHEDK